MAPPIIIIHRGDSPYLADCIAQAKSSNPNSRVILLGDRSNCYYLGVEHYSYQDYFIEAEKFAALFEHKYFPTYQYSWILFCHQKYFALRDFCKIHGIGKFLLIDSDVMIYENIEACFERYKDSCMTVICDNPKAYVAGAWFSIFQKSSMLDELCAIYTQLFSEAGREIRERLQLERFYEMTGLYLLMEQNPEKVKNMYSYKNQDHVMNLSMEWDERFEYDGSFLKVIWSDGIPYLVEKESGEEIRAPMLHFHGKGKYVMGKYLKISSAAIAMQHLINKTINSLVKYPMRLANLFHNGVFPRI